MFTRKGEMAGYALRAVELLTHAKSHTVPVKGIYAFCVVANDSGVIDALFSSTTAQKQFPDWEILRARIRNHENTARVIMEPRGADEKDGVHAIQVEQIAIRMKRSYYIGNYTCDPDGSNGDVLLSIS